MRACPSCRAPLEPFDVEGQPLDYCAGCHGLFLERGQLAALAGRRPEGEPTLTEEGLACPGCGEPLDAVARGEIVWHRCAGCEGAWVPAERLGPLRELARAAPATGVASRPRPGASEPVPVVSDRIGFGHPLVQLLAYPVAALIGFTLAVLRLAEAPVYFARLWVHEIGHAIPAWLSGRAALPLPIGLTFWKEESSWFTAACMLFLIGVFGFASLRERRVFGVALAATLLVLQVICTLLMPDGAMIEWILAGGLAGELIVSAALIVAFYYPLPDRFRWDFWRFVVLLPAMCAFAGAFVMWARIDAGVQGLPFGSIVGVPGDGSGDVERLIQSYRWTREGMTAFYRSVGSVCLAVIVGHYAAFGLRAFVTARRDGSPSASAGAGAPS